MSGRSFWWHAVLTEIGWVYLLILRVYKQDHDFEKHLVAKCLGRCKTHIFLENFAVKKFTKVTKDTRALFESR